VNGVGAGPAATELQLFVGCAGPPSAPANLTQSVAGNLVSLGWSPVPNVSGYVLDVGLSSGGTDLVLPVGSTTSVAGVAPSGRYFVRARAQNACGSSAPSNQVEVVVP
jgi:hypothetical protein